MSYDLDDDLPQHLSDGNDPACPYCGRRVKSSVSRECPNCASGRVAAKASEPPLDRPLVGSIYPPITMTPEQLADWRVQCAAYDAVNTGEPVPEEEVREIEEEVLFRK